MLAEDQETLNRVLALRLIARTRAADITAEERARLRAALLEERWGDAVELWMSLDGRPEVDVYPSFDLYSADDVELAELELRFTALFEE
ncbi:MAG TPA: hypothetical protein VMV02_08905 [Acidimicrobiales bacterium]|nr:hypothetical protein [Acidimicrobiales bacterium]